MTELILTFNEVWGLQTQILKETVFYLINNLISIHAKSENKITQPKSSKGGSIFSFFLIISLNRRIIIGKILSWNWIPQNLR